MSMPYERGTVWCVALVVFGLLACKALDVWEAREDAKYRAPEMRSRETSEQE